MSQVFHSVVSPLFPEPLFPEPLFPEARLDALMQPFTEWDAEPEDAESADTGGSRPQRFAPQRFADDISLVIAAYMKAANLGLDEDFSDQDKADCLGKLVGS